MKKMTYCKRCVYPQVSVNLSLDAEGVCSSCRSHEKFEALTPDFWAARQKKFEEIIEEVKRKQSSNYDCLIPASGGKDSYYQAHKMASDYGLKPLIVTYHGNNYLPEGDYNRDRMREVFDADHIVFGPSVSVLKKLNRICFKKMGDMNWQNHCGIFTYPIIAAAKFNIPLIIWGEIAWDISGMFDPNDMVEFSARIRHEHDLRGFEWYDMLDDASDILSEKDLLWAKYPSDKEILKSGIRGLYIGNFFKWDPNQHTEQMQRLYGWRQSQTPFERTYRLVSNLDDRYENGAHDLLKFIKFGYGRCSDHASKDIRSGYITREEGTALVQKYDHIVSSDLKYWLDYVEMSEDEFWYTADGFRDPRVWTIQDGLWWKDTLSSKFESFGDVALPKEQWQKFQD